MARDWIKYQATLPTAPEVLAIASRMKLDRFGVCGRVAAVWAWAGEHTVDGLLPHATPDGIDLMTERKGFAEAMAAVGWLVIEEGGLRIPKWDVHNSRAAKERALNARRMGIERRMKSAQACGSDPHTDRTDVREGSTPNRHQRREEKSTEDSLRSSSPRTSGKATWSAVEGFSIPSEVLERWAVAYPACNIARQAAAANEWLLANPRKQKKDPHRFLMSWLERSQERGGDVSSNRPGQQVVTVPRPIASPDGWREACVELWPEAPVPGDFAQLPTSVQRDVNEFLKKKKGDGGNNKMTDPKGPQTNE